MKNLYTEQGLDEIKKAKKRNLIIFFICLAALLITIILCVFFSTYRTRKLFTTLCCILSSIETCFSLFFLFADFYYKRLMLNYIALKDGVKEETVLNFVDISEKPVTLSDKSTAYIVKATSKRGNRTLYLSSLFNNDIFVLNEKYRFETCYDYIVGYKNEH